MFSGEKEIEKEKEDVEEIPEEIQKMAALPKRTPSIEDRIEFRQHLSEIYEGFSTGTKTKPTSEIDRIQEEESLDTNSALKDFSHSSIFSSIFDRPPEKETKKRQKINLKDAVIAEAILKRPKMSKSLKNFNKK